MPNIGAVLQVTLLKVKLKRTTLQKSTDHEKRSEKKNRACFRVCKD